MDYARFRDYNDYIIFMNGKVYSLISNMFLKPCLNKKSGYFQFSLSKDKKVKIFLLHRILAECFIKNPHNFTTIDHIDRNKQNNKISNLRFASKTLQSINRNIHKTNTSGIVGVRFHKKNNYYIAFWRINYKLFSKTFSLNKYPNAKQLAIDYRAKMVEKHYKDVI